MLLRSCSQVCVVKTDLVKSSLTIETLPVFGGRPGLWGGESVATDHNNR